MTGAESNGSAAPSTAPYTLERAARDGAGMWNGGACNPRAIARAIVRAVDAICETGGSDAIKGADAAPVRLMLAHFAALMQTGFDGFGDCKSEHGDSSADLARCAAIEGGGHV